MLRWILLLAVIGGLYWIYQRDYLGGSAPAPAREAAAPLPTREGAGRLGGGLNPFVTDSDHGGGAQRPPMPKIP